MSTLDDYLRLLADEQKRKLLRELLDADGDPVELEVDDEEEYTRLYHVIISKMADAGLVEWDPRDDIIVRGPDFDDIVPLLNAIDSLANEDEDVDEEDETRNTNGECETGTE